MTKLEMIDLTYTKSALKVHESLLHLPYNSSDIGHCRISRIVNHWECIRLIAPNSSKFSDVTQKLKLFATCTEKDILLFCVYIERLMISKLRVTCKLEKFFTLRNFSRIVLR